ncbi:hypothetical protein JOF53_007963 [Crossiella equi]|uniref:Uncharacterized protein n=1 Tax=Crossiella equi TaxID=130796 RepID=A0ABS5ARP4_9PSEU|nr:hypothetical protein [Crossiella equi]MBP2479091.1 hypothetical protein [Crossiella equi]
MSPGTQPHRPTPEMVAAARAVVADAPPFTPRQVTYLMPIVQSGVRKLRKAQQPQ